MTDVMYDFGKVKNEPRGTALSSGSAVPSKGMIDRTLSMIRTPGVDSIGYEGYTKEQFMADLKEVSRPLVAGPKLSREEASRRIDERHSRTQEALGDE